MTMKNPVPFCLAVLWLVTAAAAEKISLESYASGIDTVPVAVLPFKPAAGSGPLGKDLPWQVIADDLEFSCRFSVLRVDKVDSAVFAQKGIGIFIDGEYSVSGGGVVIDCYIRDALSFDLLLGKKYRGELQYMRGMAHRFSNQLVEILFGEKGVFETKIVYVHDETNTKNLYLVDYDGYNRKRLTNTPTYNLFPSFIDSTNIVWTAYLRGKPDLYKGSIETGKSAIFVYSRAVQTSPAYSPIENKFAYASSKPGNMEIFTCDADGTNQRRLTFSGGIDTSPCWSPNGYQIAFISDRAGNPNVYIMDSEGANSRRLTFEGNWQDSPAWSPRGDRIAFTSRRDGKFDIYTVGPDGSGETRITAKPGNNQYPAWSADGMHLVFASESSGRSDLFLVRHDGSGLRQITTGGMSRMPDWSHF